MWKILMLLCLVGCTCQVEENMSPGYSEDVQHGWGATSKLRNFGKRDGNGFSVQSGTVLIEPATYTVSFRVGALKGIGGLPNTGQPNFSPYAEIFWSLGGVDTRRVVSVANGTTVSGVCEKFKVIAYDDSKQTGGGGTGEYDVAIEVGRGVRPTTGYPPSYVDPVTGGLYQVPPATVTTVPIPQDIGVSSVMVTVVPNSPGVVFGPVDAVVVQVVPAIATKIYNPRDYNFVPILPGANAITLNNNQPALGGSDALFQVTWGIDG